MDEMYYNSRDAIRKTARSVRRCFVMYIVTIHDTPIFTAKPEGEWISRAGHLEQVFQSNV